MKQEYGIHPPRGIATHDFLPPSCLKVLGVLMAFKAHGVTPTNREIAQEMGLHVGGSSPEGGGNWHVLACLRRLRSMGLIDYKETLARTTRPLCRVVAGPNGAIPPKERSTSRKGS